MSLADEDDTKIYLWMEDTAVKPLMTFFNKSNYYALRMAVEKKMSEIGTAEIGDLWKSKRIKDKRDKFQIQLT